MKALAKAIVIILKGEDGASLAYEALEKIGAKDVIAGRKKVIVKPNITVSKPAETGITTDPKVVEGVLNFCRDMGVREMMIAEGGGCDTAKAFDELGFKDVAKRLGARLVDLNRDQARLVKVPRPAFLSEFWISESSLGCDCLISVPSLKTHKGMWLVTLSMKNMMGVLAPGKRGSIHHEDRGIVDLLQIVKPNLAIIDGIVGSEGDELTGDPVKMGLIIAGKDCVAVDTVGAAVMGFAPDEVRHITLAEHYGLGVSNLQDIEVVGRRIEEVCVKFRRAP